MLTPDQLDLWCSFLEAYPEMQGRYYLHDTTHNTMCCLGAMCHVLGLPGESVVDDTALDGSGRINAVSWDGNVCTLGARGALLLYGKPQTSRNIGVTEVGGYHELNMPALVHGGRRYHSLAQANDALVPWAVIAAHLRAHYPTGDTD